MQPFAQLLQVLPMEMGTSLNWDGIVETLGPKLYRYFCARFEDVVSDDLTQETLVRLVSKVNSGEFDHSKGTLEMFAFGIARFVRLEELKRNHHSDYEDSNNIDPQGLLEESLEKSNEIVLLRRGISSLSEPEQEIILLMVDQDWGHQQISQHMNMPIGTVKSHVHRAKKNIFNFLNTKGGVSYGRL